MTSRRVGLVLAVLLAAGAVVPALQIGPDPETGETGSLPVLVAVLSVGVAVATVALVVPAWRGGRRAALAIGILQLVSIAPALPAFLVPADVVPAGGVVLAAVSCLLNVTAVGLITVERTSLLLYAAAIASVLALYAAGVAMLTTVAPEAADRGVQTLVALAAALAFHPMLMLLRRTVGGRIYGGRADPARAAQRIHTLSNTAAVIEETARILRLPRLELLDRGQPVAVSGQRVAGAATHDIPVGADGRLSLRVTIVGGRRRLHPDELVALDLVARPLGLLVREAELADDLRAARAAAAVSREEERATIHRELHDGVGPLLTGAAFRVDAATNLAAADAAGSRRQLEQARADLRTAIAEVRRVVDGLRPLELEQLGLWDALKARAAATGAALRLPSPRPALSAATEVAVYRIVAEALSNAERHAPRGATRADVAVADGRLTVDVTTSPVEPARDDARRGVGIPSIVARAEEVGGRASVGPVPEGWRVHVDVPLAP